MTERMVEMSKTRFPWYRHVQREIYRNIRANKSPETLQDNIAKAAIEEAIAETEKTLKDAQERLKLVDLVYRRQTHTVAGAALELHISERVASDWSSLFVYMVGEQMGFARAGSIERWKKRSRKDCV